MKRRFQFTLKKGIILLDLDPYHEVISGSGSVSKKNRKVWIQIHITDPALQDTFIYTFPPYRGCQQLLNLLIQKYQIFLADVVNAKVLQCSVKRTCTFRTQRKEKVHH